MKQEEITLIFNKIASYYDKVNNIISLGLHKIIKKDSIKMLEIIDNSKVVDLCTGSGDFVHIINKQSKSLEIIGVDNCENMLKIAKKKNPNNLFINADCTNLPFDNNSIDYITISFGLRNIINRAVALKEINRVLKRGGKFLHLDFGKHNILSSLFNLYVITLTKFVGYDNNSYKWLIQSKNNYPEPRDLIEEFEKIGFTCVKTKSYFFDTISLQIMKKTK